MPCISQFPQKLLYKDLTELFVVDGDRTKEIILGPGGATQDDSSVMYSISLIHYLAVNQDQNLPVAKQAWFADGVTEVELTFSKRKGGRGGGGKCH